MRFSERHGYSSVRDAIQRESMDSALRNGLWSLLYESYLTPTTGSSTAVSRNKKLCERLWKRFFKKPVDTVPGRVSRRRKTLREWFFDCEWYEAYDFVEAVPKLATGRSFANRNFRKDCNALLKRELAGYRFVDDEIVPITAEEEVAEVEEALEQSGRFPGVREHLREALADLGDREQPNYRNVVKEAISAVEAMSATITGDDNATLGQALKVLEEEIELHGALKEAFSKLYGYTSDAEGIRHALMEESTLDQEDAKFMLVACSAFVNYLVVKASKASIKFG